MPDDDLIEEGFRAFGVFLIFKCKLNFVPRQDQESFVKPWLQIVMGSSVSTVESIREREFRDRVKSLKCRMHAHCGAQVLFMSCTTMDEN